MQIKAEIANTFDSVLNISISEFDDVDVHTEFNASEGKLELQLSGAIDLAGREYTFEVDEDKLLYKMHDTDIMMFAADNFELSEVMDQFSCGEVDKFVSEYTQDNAEDWLTKIPMSDLIGELLGRTEFSVGKFIDTLIAVRIGKAVIEHNS